MRVLGLDPGSRRTGYGVVERHGNAYACLIHGHVAPPAGLSLAERLHRIARAAGEIIERFAPDAVVVEGAFYHRNVRSTLVLGHVRGALLVAAAERDVPIAEYSPREIKMSVAGNGSAAKEQVAFMVRRVLGLAAEPQADAADALAGALCHLHRATLGGPPGRRTSANARLLALVASRGVR